MSALCPNFPVTRGARFLVLIVSALTTPVLAQSALNDLFVPLDLTVLPVFKSG